MTKAVWSALLLAATVSVSGCAPPAISDIAHDKVKVVGSGDQRAVMVEAERGCAIYKRTPIAISSRCLDAYCTQKEYLFACKEPG